MGDGVEKVKKVLSTVVKSAVTRYIVMAIIIFSIITFTASAIYYITVDDGTYKEDDWSSTPYGAGQYTSNITINDDGTISSSMTAKELWDKMIENNSKIDLYLDGPEDLLKLMNAETITRFPDTREEKDLNKKIDWDLINNVEESVMQGIIKFKRKNSKEKESFLSYVEPDTFFAWVSNGDKRALSHFTLSNPINAVGKDAVAVGDGIMTDVSQAIIDATAITPSKGTGYCLGWVDDVYSNAGLGGYTRQYCASASWLENGISTDLSAIPIGAAVYGSGSGNGDGPGSYPYGHIGIYLGGGMVIDNKNNSIDIQTMEEFASWQTLYGWGWADGNKTRGTSKDSNASEYTADKNDTKNDENNEDTTTDTNNTNLSNNNYQVVVATWSETTYKMESDDPEVTKTTKPKEYKITTSNINYQDFISGYTMPFDYLWQLLVVSEDKDFVFDIADLVYDSKIEITIFDNYTETETSTTTTRTEGIGNDAETYTTTITTTYKNNVLETALTLADVWIVEYSQEFDNQKDGKNNKYVSVPPVIKEKVEKDDPKDNFVKILLKRSNSKAKNNILSVDDWLFELIETNKNTVDMLDLTKFLLYKATGKDYGVTEFDFSIYDPKNFKPITTAGGQGSEGGLSLTTTIFTKEVFKQALQAYYDKTGNQAFYKNFLVKADELYDASISNNVNPELVVITARGEGNFSESGGRYNYWGNGVPNGASSGFSYSSLSEGIAGYANTLSQYVTGAKAAEIMQRYEQRKAAGCDPLGYGLPGTLSGMQSLYSFLGNHIYGDAGAGGYYYMDPARAGVTKIYTTHQEFLDKCKNSGLPEHASGTVTTVWEQGQYTAWQVESKLKYWDEIFGSFGSRTSTDGSGKIVELAKSKVGCPYVWGAKGPNSFDCSGLVYYCYQQQGIIVPMGTEGYRTYQEKEISWSQAQPGDILIAHPEERGSSTGHAAIYLGNDSYIHAPGTGKTVTIVDSGASSNFKHVYRFD